MSSTPPPSKPSEPRLFPIQASVHHPGCRFQGLAPEAVYMAAYEVYVHLYGEQRAMIDLEGHGCSGGWGTGEMVAFLYARAFPREQWRARVDEAFRGLNL